METLVKSLENVLILVGYDEQGNQTGIEVIKKSTVPVQDIRAFFRIWPLTKLLEQHIITGVSEPVLVYHASPQAPTCEWSEGCEHPVSETYPYSGLCKDHYHQQHRVRPEFRLLRFE